MARLGSGTKTADQSGAFSGEIDITSLTATVTVQANRRVRIYAIGSFSDTLADATAAVMRIKEGATVLKEVNRVTTGSTRTTFIAGWVEVDNPSAGSHTYKISFQIPSSSGTIVWRASATSPSLILVEDIGSH